MLSLRIALRYLFSAKSHSAVNVISVISVVGVAVATAAIVVVLSVFNGFGDLASGHLSRLDPQLKVVPVNGKVIEDADSMAASIARIDGVDAAVPLIEERGLAVFGNEQMPVVFMGVDTGLSQVADIEDIIIDGVYTDSVYEFPCAQLAAGVAMRLGARPSPATTVSFYVPRRTGRINPANPAAAFRGEELAVSGVFQVGQLEYDADHVILPLGVARNLLEYTTEATSIAVAGTIDAADLQKALGSDVRVLTRMQQQEQAFRMIAIEKWVTFLMLAFILVIASFNIISTLSLLVIEKRDNMATLRALGAPLAQVRSIFMYQGALITVLGGIGGIILGAALALAQQYGHFIKLAGDPSNLTVPAYPVRLDAVDMIVVLALVIIVALIISQIVKLFIRN